MILREAWTAAVILSALLGTHVVESSLDEADTPTVDGGAEISAIYGRDDRKEIFEVKNPVVVNAARAVVLLADAESVRETGRGTFALEGMTYGESLNLCKSERFWEQPRIGFCSGVLISPFTVLTAGHCVVTEKDCENTRFLFQVGYVSPGRLDMEVPAARVRACRKIIKRQNKNSGVDFALIELDRAVTDQKIAHLASSEESPARLFMIGHPLGLPAKYSGMAHVTKDERLNWLTDLDSSAGNSGSPVFDGDTGHLIGMLTAGEDGDFQKTSGKSCKLSKRCTPETCYGEVVLKAGVIREQAGL